ncbi:MAG: M20/M25/M40 family metallo-hydrolase [Betaproteobacteria bacterium]|nr:MAG: M20/M25/M40 family metallo-hydrolase [Betaproteobacteria bacterium]
MSNATQERIATFLRDKQAAETAFIAELVKVPSDNPPGDCAPHAKRAAELLEGLGFRVEQYAVPDDAVRASGMISATNLVVRERFGDGPVIACNAHGDVVPPGLGWSVDPYGAQIKDGYMYGRGVAVSKSDFATYAFALLALQASGAKLNGTVELHLTYDEEAGGLIGPARLLEQKISQPDYAISAGFSYAVTTAHNGCLHLEVEVIGKSAHAAMPSTGVDALEAATGVLSDTYAIRKTYAQRKSKIAGIDSPTLTVGLITGGINTNVVPDTVTLRLDRRIIPEEDPAQVEATLTKQIKESAAKWPGISCNVRRILLAVPFVPMPGQEKLVEAITRNGTNIMGEEVKSRGSPLYTDARLYSATGVPTVLYGAGPHTLLEANGHRADEKLKLDDLHKATLVIALAIYDLLGE